MYFKVLFKRPRKRVGLRLANRKWKANKMEGKRKVSHCLVTPPRAAVVLNEISIVLNVRLTVLNYGQR